MGEEQRFYVGERKLEKTDIYRSLTRCLAQFNSLHLTESLQEAREIISPILQKRKLYCTVMINLLFSLHCGFLDGGGRVLIFPISV